MSKVTAAWVRFFVLILALWSLFGIAVATMIVYGVFDNVAMTPAVMATAIATGTAIFTTLLGFSVLGLVKRLNRALSDSTKS
jgi:hypothetical protein